MTGSGSSRNVIFFGAAQPVPQDGPLLDRPLSKSPGLSKEASILISVVLGLLVLLLIWAKFIRTWKPRKRLSNGQRVYREGNRPSGEESDEDGDDDDDDESEDSGDKNRRRYKYRYRRRKHRQRNPTLAETGGLPPVKDE